MAINNTGYEHVVLNDQGVPEIAGTSMKVVELVVEYNSFGWSPEEIQFNHPYLTLGQVYSALAYYWDHKVALDTDIQGRSDYAERLRQASGPSPVQTRLRPFKSKSSD
ncbi:MAG: DUF433 domain-containing protein [Chloroflexota bacterium]|nr:DUF433 domain-containing protein [Chloroflexota bacterium]